MEVPPEPTAASPRYTLEDQLEKEPSWSEEWLSWLEEEEEEWLSWLEEEEEEWLSRSDEWLSRLEEE